MQGARNKKHEPFPLRVSCFLPLASYLLAFFFILVLSSCQGQADPPPEPTILQQTPLAIPTVQPEGLGVFLPALRPEFATDLDGMAGATRYEIGLHLDAKTLRLTGRETVRYTNQETVALDQLYFRLFPNSPACTGWTAVEDVQVNGRPAEPAYEAEETALRLPLDPPLQPGEQAVVAMRFVDQVPISDSCHYAAFSYDEPMLALAHFYPQIPAYEGNWPISVPVDQGDLVFADVAFYSVTATLPVGWVVAAGGSEVARTASSAGEVNVSWVSGPARDFVLELSPDYLTSTQEFEDVRVTSYYLPDHLAGGQQALTATVDALRVYQDLFGPYRYGDLDVVESRTEAGGVEYPGLVVVATEYYSPATSSLTTVTAHEIAHQWWYSLVGNNQVNEPWLDEALTSYSTVLFWEKTWGDEAAEQLLDYYRRGYQAVVDAGLDAPANQPVSAYTDETYGPLVYSKGALFFDALRSQVGDDVFFQILRQYYQRYQYGIATGEGFLQVAEEVSGQDLQPLYEKWILSPVVTPGPSTTPGQ